MEGIKKREGRGMKERKEGREREMEGPREGARDG
jgi:hypothetical protein